MSLMRTQLFYTVIFPLSYTNEWKRDIFLYFFHLLTLHIAKFSKTTRYYNKFSPWLLQLESEFWKTDRSLQLVTRLDFSDLLVESVNITADSSSVIRFSVIHQILTIPQTEPLARSHGIRRERRQDNLRGERVISGNPGPLSTTMCNMFHKLTRRQYDLISGCCYDNIYVVFYVPKRATAPEGPVGMTSSVTGHVTAQVDQFYGRYFATVRYTESAILGTSRAKTDCTVIDFVPVRI